jgi:hypothetical protein
LETTAFLCDAPIVKPVGQPIKLYGWDTSAQFSPDGQRVVTASGVTAQVWDVATITDKDTKEDILLLAELAEAIGGVTSEIIGQAENLTLLAPEQIIASREKIAAKFPGPSSQRTPLQRFMKWSVSDRRSRTISPFSQLTMSEWLDNLITEGRYLTPKVGVERLRAAVRVEPANALVTALLGRRLADLALELGNDPDEARHAREEADFLTSRALKLNATAARDRFFVPYSDDVKKLRDEVIKLLELKMN